MQREQPDSYQSCDVCGRTLLKGELVHEYLTPQRSKQGVCVHCRSRAEASGWIPVALAEAIGQEPPSRAGRGQALRERLGRAASRARPGARGTRRAATNEADASEPQSEPPKAKAEAKQPPEKPREKRARPQAERPRKRAPQRAKSRSKQRSAARTGERTPRPRRGPEALMRRAVERFNHSEEARKVAGLIRSLGEPHVGVRADAPRQLALVTVAWELSWYQWEVAADGNGQPVREIAKGKEMSELAEDARAWNAAVSKEGKLRLRSAARRKSAAKKA